MIESREIGQISIAWLPIDDAPGYSSDMPRRQAERNAVKYVVRQLTGEQVEIGHNQWGAPEIEGWKISISHSRRLAIAAISRNETIGIDAQEWRESLIRVKTKFLSKNEEKWIADSDLLRAWTVKEAVYKAAGDHRLPLTAIEIGDDWNYATANGMLYALQSFEIGPDMVTLCIRANA